MDLKGLRKDDLKVNTQMCTPRVFAFTPNCTFQNINGSASKKAEKMSKSGHVVAEFQHRTMIPFWRVVGHSTFKYDRARMVDIATDEGIVLSIDLHGASGSTLALPINGAGHVSVKAIEHCESRQSISKIFTDSTEGKSQKLLDLTTILSKDDVDWKEYSKNSLLEITDRVSYSRNGVVGDEYLHLGYSATQFVNVIQPSKNADAIVTETIQSLARNIKKGRIIPNEATIVFDAIDLYYRPVFVYSFKHFDKNAKLHGQISEQVDGLTGTWSSDQSFGIDLNLSPDLVNTLLLTVDVAAEVIKVAHPTKLTAAIAEVAKGKIHGALGRNS